MLDNSINAENSGNRWRSGSSTASSFLKGSNILQKALSFGLLMVLVLPSIAFGQAARSETRADSIVKAPVKGEAQPTTIDTPQMPDAAPEGSPCGWTAATVSPIPILDQATTTVGSNLYSFAGVSTAIIATANKFDGTTWSSIAAVPVALEFPTAVSNGTSAYIINGVDGTGTSVNTLYRYNPGTNDYTTLAPSATSTWNHASAYLNGKIYKIGGYNSAGGVTTGLNSVEIYDIASNTWSAGAPYPLAQGWMSAFVQGNFLYVAGGLASTTGAVPSTKTYRYDPANNSWDDAAIADLPVARWASASSQTVYNDGWVLAGGYINGTAATDLSNTVTKWDPVSNSWSALPTMLGARARMSGAVLNGSFHVIGGRSSAGGFTGTNDNQKLFCNPTNQPFIQSSLTYVSDNGTPVNNVPDPGETVTVSLALNNIGGVATGNVVATLATTGGITNPSGPIAFGVIAPGTTVSRSFTFQVPANAPCGSQITLSFSIADGATTYTLTKVYTLGVLQTTFTENFDGVTAPALPAGWSAPVTGGGIAFVTTATGADSAPNAAFAPDVATVSTSELISPTIAVSSATATLNFRNSYNTENTFDGAVLEISIAGGAYQDIITAGGSFVSGGYNGLISTAWQSPIAGRNAWTGNSAGYINTSVALPAAANGQNVNFKWIMASDSSVAATGVFVDSVTVAGSYLCSTPGTGDPVKSRGDFDGDGKTDLAVFRPSNSSWYVNGSTAGFSVVTWGAAGDRIVPADYDGDGKADYAIYRGTPDAEPDFYILTSGNFTISIRAFGNAGDIPTVGDYDGDGKADTSVYRPSTNTWYVLTTAGFFSTSLGASGDVPMPGDYDGDGKTDRAIFSNGVVTIQKSTGGTSVINWGAAGDKPVPADYDGDNKDDVAVWRPSNGGWYVLKSSDGLSMTTTWGVSGDVPAPGDYDGDGKDDYAVYRAGTWYLKRSTAGFATVVYGVAADVPVPAGYIP